MATDNWYQHTDLTLVSLDTLRERTKDVHIADPQAFYKHLCALLPVTTTGFATDDELQSNDDELVKKIFHLVGLFDSSEPTSDFYAFHTLIRIACSVFRGKNGRVFAKSNDAAADGNARLLKFVKERFGAQRSRVGHPTNSRPRNPSYYNFAAAYRKVRSAWKDVSCLGDIRNEKTCWHQQTEALLSYLQRRAYGEIRGNVMLTIGTKLPTELTERVSDFALAAEEVPEEAVMDQTEILEFKQWQEYVGWVKTLRTVKLMWYHCDCERNGAAFAGLSEQDSVPRGYSRRGIIF